MARPRKQTVKKTQAQAVTEERNKATVEKTARLTADTVFKSISTLKTQTTSALDELSNKINEKMGDLADVTKAIETQKLELKALYDIAAEADTLQKLRDQIAIEEAADAEHDQLTQLRREESDARYEKERQEYVAKVKRDREWEEEQYQHETGRRREEEELTHRARLQAGVDALMKRDDDLRAREQNAKALEEQVAGLDARVKGEVDKAVAIATNSLKKDLMNAHQLERMTLQNANAMQAQEIVTLKGQINLLAKANEALEHKLDQATGRVQEIAQKAIDGASKQAPVIHMPSPEPEGRNRK